MRFGPLIVVCLAVLALDDHSAAQSVPLLEVSGVARQGDWLLIVDDSQRGAYFRFPLHGNKGPVIALGPNRLERITLPGASLATDLEAIGVLGDGRVVVLSERLRALFSSDGLIAEYEASFSEFGKRGLEGLAVRRMLDGSSRVAVMWEGGYPMYRHVQEQLRRPFGRKALQPIIQTHSLLPGEAGVQVHGSQFIHLDVPIPAGHGPSAQRFRAPDLVWYRHDDGSWGFITLLSSQNSAQKPQYLYHWLQRFSHDGKRVGKPLDLNRVVPEKFKGANWEGLGWFKEGKSLVIVHESHPKTEAVAFVLTLPEDWRSRPPPGNEFTHWLPQETEYYLNGPQQSHVPDGKLRAGTKVQMLEGAQPYCRVRTEADLVVYVETARLKPVAVE